MPDRETVESLRTALRGTLLEPGDDEYDEARALFNGMHDRKPALIAQCAGTADVITCVNFARENTLKLSVKGGGHGVAGNAACDGGLMIDLSRMNAVLVDPDLKTAQVQAGARIGDMDHETQAFGLATTAGIDSRTGVAGLTLGGGNGHLARTFGLACDNLLAADVVTADGKLVRASESENPDLLWALKGGGGNFGVVTTFEFKLHQVGPEIMTAQAYHPFDNGREVLEFYRDYIASAPNEAGCVALVMRVPPVAPFPEERHGQLCVALVASYSGDLESGKQHLKPIEDFGSPILSFMMPMPYTALQSAFNAGFPKGARYYWKGHFLRELSGEAIDTILSNTEPMPGEFTVLAFETYGGAINEVDATATAFPHRDAMCSFAIFSGWLDPAMDDEGIAWTRAFHQAMERYSTGGTYVNYIQGDAGDEVNVAYGANYERLRQVKAKYDPHNLFSAHQRIETSSDPDYRATHANV